MNIVRGKIVEATLAELFQYYLAMGYEDFYDFPDFVYRVEKAGAKVIRKEENENN